MYVFVRLLGLALCALSLTGCLVETNNSIIENPLSFDQGLVGTWARTEDDFAWLLMVQPDKADQTLGKVAYVYVEPRDDNIEVGRTLFDVRLTEIGGAVYFEAVPKGPDPFPDASDPVGRFIGRIALQDADTLRVEIPDAEFVKEAVEAGRLQGDIEADNLNRTVTLTGTTSEMRAFLSTSVPADADGTSVYRRLK